jgi:DNA (cytosine-5)-methyltransferase 1
MNPLTKKQKSVLDFVASYIDEYGIAPTIEEIKKGLQLGAVSTVHSHIRYLVDKGYLRRMNGSPRGLEVVDRKKIVEVPIVGNIAAGKPIEAIEAKEDFVAIADNEKNLDIASLYALRVIGDSMIEEGIFNGDVVVIRRQEHAENGQTVVAIVDHESATLKKIYKEKNRIRLQPANQALLPIFVKDIEIRGVVVQVIRGFDQEARQPTLAQNATSTGDLGFRTIDLFAGVGGIRLGFEAVGFKTVFANDFEPACKVTYDCNSQDVRLTVEDIRKIDVDTLPEFDFLLGGFPCQAFSIAGYRQGFQDEKGRGNLFFDVARIIEARSPKGFLLENVKNLKTHDGGRTFRIIIETLEGLGYHIKAKVLNSMEYGNIPQNRERIYIVGFKDESVAERFSFPSPKKLSVKIADLLEKNVESKYYYNDKPLYAKLKDIVTEEGRVYQWRRRYVRENKKGVCPTLTANMGMGGHNVPIIKDGKGIRKLTPLECARIQGFPKEFELPTHLSDAALYKQMGNSVTVTVIEAIARSMMVALNG